MDDEFTYVDGINFIERTTIATGQVCLVPKDYSNADYQLYLLWTGMTIQEIDNLANPPPPPEE